MSIWVFVAIAVWPITGLVVLSLVDRWLHRHRHMRLPSAEQPGDVLLRMYLWPLVCWRIWRTVLNR